MSLFERGGEYTSRSSDTPDAVSTDSVNGCACCERRIVPERKTCRFRLPCDECRGTRVTEQGVRAYKSDSRAARREGEDATFLNRDYGQLSHRSEPGRQAEKMLRRTY